MRKVSIQILMILFFSLSFFAQTENRVLVLVDEFGAIDLDDLMARLDHAATIIHSELPKNPSVKLRVRMYGGIENSFAGAYFRGSLIEGYLKHNRGLTIEQFSIEYCSVNKEDLRTQIYVSLQSEQLPKCDNNLDFLSKTVRFANVHFYTSELKFTAVEDTAPEISFSEGNYSKAAFRVLKNLLESSPGSKIYVVAYLQAAFEKNEIGKVIRKQIDKKSFAPKMLRAAKSEMIKEGFNNSQIEMVEGGYLTGDYERRLEFYFVPKNGEIPKPMPDYFPKKK